MNKIFCINCQTHKSAFEFNKKGEHILPSGFGNNGATDAVLKNRICLPCNQKYGEAIDKPFLRHVVSREIANTHGMKRRHPENEIKITGSGYLVQYETSVAHLFECVKIAFETHIKFLGEEYRDDKFYLWRQFLQSIIEGYDALRANMKGQLPHGRTIEEVWADTGQGIIAFKYFNIISQNIYRLDKITNNAAEIMAEVVSRSGKDTYASLILISCWDFGVAVMVCLQSLPPIVVCVSNQRDRYIDDFGRTSIHVMDLRSSEKWTGRENGILKYNM